MSLLIALMLVGHAVMHVGAVACGLLFATTAPWIVTGAGVDRSLVEAAAVALAALVVAGYLPAAMAAAGIVVPARWWRPLVVGASTASAVLLAGMFGPAAVPGLLIDGLLVWAVVGRSWRPAPFFARRTSRPA